MGRPEIYPPRWAVRPAQPGDREAALRARERGALRTNWDVGPVTYDRPHRLDGPPKAWARAQGWRTPWFTFASAFLDRMLASDADFDLALRASGAVLYLPIEAYEVPAADLKDFDRLYDKTDRHGRPTGWGSLVGALREIRRAVEAGVVVTVDGATLVDFDSFYAWAHGRYHALEDGYDSWIGDDET